MSISTMNLVWERSCHKSGALTLLLAIADFADDCGIAYPSVSRLAQKTRMTERNVQIQLRKLVESKELSIRDGVGPHGCNVYHVNIAYLERRPKIGSTGEKSSGVKKVRGEKRSKKGVKKSTEGGETHFTRSTMVNHHDDPPPPCDDDVDTSGGGENSDEQSDQESVSSTDSHTQSSSDESNSKTSPSNEPIQVYPDTVVYLREKGIIAAKIFAHLPLAPVRIIVERMMRDGARAGAVVAHLKESDVQARILAEAAEPEAPEPSPVEYPKPDWIPDDLWDEFDENARRQMSEAQWDGERISWWNEQITSRFRSLYGAEVKMVEQRLREVPHAAHG